MQDKPNSESLDEPGPRRRVTPTSLDLEITATTGHEDVDFLRQHLLAAHALLGPPLRELSLALVGDRRMSALHQQYMDIPGPTDVLTFPLESDARGRTLAGEVVVCVPEARRQAMRHGVPVRHEILLYALHGLLHLCGFDDTTDSAYRKMHRTEDDILTRLGLGRIFEPEPIRT